MITLGEAGHAGTHAQQARVLYEQGCPHAAETRATRNRQRFLFMRCTHQLHRAVVLDANENFAEPTVRHGYGHAEPKPLERGEQLGWAMLFFHRYGSVPPT